MTNMPSDEEMVAEIERQIAEGTEFDGLIPVHSSAPKVPRSVFSIRLAPEEMKAISQTARARGVSIGDFIREAAMKEVAAEGALDEAFSPYDVTTFLADVEGIVEKLKDSYRHSTDAGRVDRQG